MKITRRVVVLALGMGLATVAIAATSVSSVFNKIFTFSQGTPKVSSAPQQNNPPGFEITSQIGSLLGKGLATAAASADSQIGAFANYDVYTPSVADSTIVGNVVNTCTSSGGGKTFGCDFTQGNSGNTILVNSLIGVSAYADDNARKAAFSFITNMTNMKPIPYPGDDKVFKNPKDKSKGLSDDGIAYFALAFKQLPSLSVARQSLLSLFSERERLPGLGGSMPVGAGGAASILEVLEYEASRRYMSPDWFNYMGSATDQAVVREMAYMMAFQNFMMVRSYEQNERIEALLVAQINAMNNLSNQGASQQTPAAQQSTQQQIQNKS